MSFLKPIPIRWFIHELQTVAEMTGCLIPVYCFMPDHLHLIVMGKSEDSDVLGMIVVYKQRSGLWMSRNLHELNWQKSFYDHIIRKHEDLAAQAKYILENPVRKELVSSWQEYPYKGAIGCRLEDVLEGIF